MGASTTGPALDVVTAGLLSELKSHLPPAVPGLPERDVHLISLTERSVGLGSRVGLRRRAGFDTVELKGVRVEATVRVQLWGNDEAEVDGEVLKAASALLNSRDALREQGVLQLRMQANDAAHQDNGIWRAAPVWQVLYEVEYEDADGAGLIARIPIRLDQEAAGSAQAEATTVTDALTRWDQTGAPPLVLRGPGRVGSLVALDFVAGAPPSGVAVSLLRTVDGAAGAPAPYNDLALFLADVRKPVAPVRHARMAFTPPLQTFLDAFVIDDGPLYVGDWDLDATTDNYTVRQLVIDPPIELPTAADRFEVTYGAAQLNQVAVVYLRAFPTA